METINQERCMGELNQKPGHERKQGMEQDGTEPGNEGNSQQHEGPRLTGRNTNVALVFFIQILLIDSTHFYNFYYSLFRSIEPQKEPYWNTYQVFYTAILKDCKNNKIVTIGVKLQSWRAAVSAGFLVVLRTLGSFMSLIG